MAAKRQETVTLEKSQKGSKFESNSYMEQERAVGLKSGAAIE